MTVLAINSMKNSYKIVTGEISRVQMANELIKEMFVTTCALTMGSICQSFIEIPVLGYMIGSFVGSIAGSVVYSAVYTPILSFCVDTGFTMFGLVDQNYELSEDVLNEIGIEVFEYEQFHYECFEATSFEFSSFDIDEFIPIHMEMIFLRRGVIGVKCIGYV